MVLFLKRFVVNTILMFVIMMVLFYLASLMFEFVVISEGVFWLSGVISIFFGFVNTNDD
jgi:hypothetical protein